jgi:hypothetical protein
MLSGDQKLDLPNVCDFSGPIVLNSAVKKFTVNTPFVMRGDPIYECHVTNFIVYLGVTREIPTGPDEF